LAIVGQLYGIEQQAAALPKSQFGAAIGYAPAQLGRPDALRRNSLHHPVLHFSGISEN
jgi:hypothetical protein